MSICNINILVVARWPLGGIRTYMRYMFTHFPADFKTTIIAASTQENKALENDTLKYCANLVLVPAPNTIDFGHAVFKELRHKKYDLLISQGFVSAVASYFANFIFRIPHIVTIHGIVESQYLEGRFAWLKRWMLGRVLTGVTVLYGVSNDILEHLYDEFPNLKLNGPQKLVILNGIEPKDFDVVPVEPITLRSQLKINDDVFLFGFFGRFMPQKGFDLIIDAVDKLHQIHQSPKIAIVAVGSGDYIREYQRTIKNRQLEPHFHFLPFQPMVHQLYNQVDTVLMPSRWEASGLLAMEVLCMGTPLIASNCFGLRETTANTPAITFQTENLEQLIENMLACMQNSNISTFQQFAPLAREKFDVTNSAKQLSGFILNLLRSNEQKTSA